MTVAVTTSLSNKLRNMSVVSAFMIVVIHCRPHFETGTFSWWVKQFLENGLTHLAVPFFFLCSGFLLAGKMAEDVKDLAWYKPEVLKRVKSLVVPYFLWLLLYWLMMQVHVALYRFSVHEPFSLEIPSLQQLGFWPSGCPVLGPLWYVRARFLLVLLAPLLYCLLTKLRVWFLVLLFALYAWACPFYPMEPWGLLQDVTRSGILPVLGFFYFTCGMAARKGIVSLEKVKVPPVAALVFAFVLIGLRASFADRWFAPYCGQLSIPFALYGVWRLVPDRAWPAWLVANAFPVYLIHRFFLYVVERMLHLNPGRNAVVYLSVAVVTFVASVASAVLMKKVAPKASAVLFGGR